jgi:hypothetical protein
MPLIYLAVMVAVLVGGGALSLLIWEKLSPSRPVRRRRAMAPRAPLQARSTAGVSEPARRPLRASPAKATVERVPAIADWAAHETTVRTLLRQRDYRTARRQIAAAFADPGITDDRRTVFEELQADAVGAEVGQLTVDAVRGSQQGEDPGALASLEQAATLLDAAGAALPAARRDEIQRRLSLAYTKVGTYRLDAGRSLDASDALLRALEFAGDSSRRTELREALAKALRQLPETPDGSHEEARRFAEELEAADAPETPGADLVTGIRALLTKQARGESGA